MAEISKLIITTHEIALGKIRESILRKIREIFLFRRCRRRGLDGVSGEGSVRGGVGVGPAACGGGALLLGEPVKVKS